MNIYNLENFFFFKGGFFIENLCCLTYLDYF